MKTLQLALIFVFFLLSTLLQAQTSFTSVQSGSWEDGATWGNTSPGVAGTDYPDDNGDDDITISAGHTVTLASNSTIDAFTINAGGIFDYNGFTLSAENSGGSITPFISVQTGNWGTGSTWLNGSSPGTSDRAILIKGHTVTANNNTIDDLTIDAGSVLDTDNNKDITVTSQLTVNGTLLLNKTGDDLTLSTGPISLSGSGTIDASLGGESLNINATTTLESGSSLTVVNSVNIANSILFTVNGDLIVRSGNIVGGNGSSQLTMGSNASVELDGSMLLTGVLDASTNSGNTVEYNGSDPQTIKDPSSSTYENLVISGTGTKTFPTTTLTLDGNLTIDGGTLDLNSQNINIGGNWTNSATISNIATVTFNGSSDQSVTTNSTDFVNVTVNKSAGTLNLNEDVIVTGTLTMTSGNIQTSGNTLSLGSGAEGSLSWTSGTILGTFTQYVSNLNSYLFPIGTSSNHRPFNIDFSPASNINAGTVSVSFVSSDPGSSGFPITDDVTLYNAFNEGYWDVSGTISLTGMNQIYNVDATGTGFSSFTIEDQTRIVTRANAGSNWAAEGSNSARSGDQLFRTSIATFGAHFAFADDTNCSGPSDPSISGTTEVCTSDTNDSYSATLNSGNEYNWTVVGGTIDGQTNPTGFVTNLNSISVDWGSTGQVGSVSVVERNGCTSSNEVTLDVNINSIDPASISGKTVVAENSTDIAYSLTGDANTSYNWTVVGGTIDGQTNPTGAIADLTSITVDWGDNGAGSVSVTATKTTPSCSASSATVLNVTKYVILDTDLSGGTGNWGTGSTWESAATPLSSESARILAGDVVEINTNESIENLIVNGTLRFTGNNRTLTVSGDLFVGPAGLIDFNSSGCSIDLTSSLSSPQAEIDGTGTISGASAGDINIFNAGKTIASSAVISFGSTITMFIDNGLTVTNTGSIDVAGDISGGDGTSTWTNSSNSTLTIGGDILTTGVLNASTSGNSVIYNTTAAANVKVPSSNYQNLEIQDGTKTLTASIDVNDVFTLTSGTFAMGTNSMTVAGDLTYTAGTLTSTGTITLDGSANQTVSGTWTIPNLTINNTLDGSDAISVSSNISVSTLLTLTDGIVGTGANVVTITNTATGGLSGGSSDSFINGLLARQTNTTGLYDFPIGSGTTYKRLGITPTATGGSTFQGQAFTAAYSDVTNINTGTLNNVSELEYWDVQQTAGTDAAQVRLYWNTQSGSAITSAAELLVAHYTGGQWESQGNGANSGDVDPGFVESATAVTSFSPFTFASNSAVENPLPVELIDFDVTENNGSAHLNWSTASEINNDYFEIQRSREGYKFDVIGKVPGNGTTSDLHTYSFIDHNTQSAYYRLRQVDYDGKFEYSPIVYFNGNLERDVLIYPIPLNENTKIHLSGISFEDLNISILTTNGTAIDTKPKSTVDEFLKVLDELPDGYYMIKFNHLDWSKVIRVIK